MTARLASGVTFTPLPYGGGVVVDGSTLTAAECAEHDADLIARLVSGQPWPGLTPAERELVDDLISRNWLLVEEEC